MHQILSPPLNEPTVTFPSDNLRPVYELCAKYPSLSELLGLRPQIRFVIDTNIVLDELLFVTTKRRKAFARTALREVLDSGVAVTIAPTKMHEEVNRHIPRLARERSVPEERFRQAWVELQAQIEFRDVRDVKEGLPGRNVRDPDDLPFVILYLSSGVDAVLTRDLDIPAMGAKALGPEALVPVRDYARAKSPEVSLRFGGVLVVGIPIVSLVASLKLLSMALRAFRNLSPELQLLLLGGVVLAALHPTSRKALYAGFSSVTTGLKNSAGLFGEVFGELSVRIAASQVELKAKETVVEGLVPTRLSVPQAFAIGSSVKDQTTATAWFDSNASLQIQKAAPRNPAIRRRTRRMSTRSKTSSSRLSPKHDD